MGIAKKLLAIIIALGLVMVGMLAVLFLSMPYEEAINNIISVEEKGIKIFSPKENEIISSPLKITGFVNGDGWTGFEGQVGTVRLLDGTGKQLATGILTATTEWTTLPTYFETVLAFTPGWEGSLVFYNENPSGDPARDKTFMLPVTLQ